MNGKRAEIKNGSHIFSATSSFILLLYGIKALKVLALSVLSFLFVFFFPLLLSFPFCLYPLLVFAD